MKVISTDPTINAAKSAEVRRLTGDNLKNQATTIPTPDGFSSRQQSRGVSDQNITAQAIHDNNSGSNTSDIDGGDDPDFREAYSDESSTAYRDVDPFADSGELQGKVAQLEQQLGDVIERLNQAKTELALEQSRRPTLYDDYYFREQLDGLRSQIRHWTATYFSHAGAYWTLYAERRFKKLSDDWAAYLEYKDRRPWLIQARIWHILQQLLFDSDSKKRFSYLFAGPNKKYSIDRLLAQGSTQHQFYNPE
jgi:hypothetical protein